MNTDATEHPGPVALRMSADGERLTLSPFPLSRWACAVIVLLGVSVLAWIPWALLGWRVPVGPFAVYVPTAAVTTVVLTSLLAGGAMLSFGLAGLSAGGAVTFDRAAGQFWKGRRGPDRATPIADIRAVRLDRHNQCGRLLIEIGADTTTKTLTLASDEQFEAVALPGRQLAEFLRLPLAGL